MQQDGVTRMGTLQEPGILAETELDHLARFNVQRSWEADSTPPALAAFSRKIGRPFPPEAVPGLLTFDLRRTAIPCGRF